MKIFGYTLIKTEELKSLRSERDKYFKYWLDEVHRLNSLVLEALEDRFGKLKNRSTDV